MSPDEPRGTFASPMPDEHRSNLSEPGDTEMLSADRASLALEAASVGSWELDLGTRQLAATARCKANHGLPPDADLQFEGHLLPSIEDTHRDRFRIALDEAIAAHGAFEIEVPHRWPDGSRHWLLVRGRVVDAARMVGISMDLTERHAVEDALHESEARYRCIVETAQEGIWTLDAAAHIEFANGRMGDLLGRSLEELVGRCSWDFAFPEDAAVLQAQFQRRRAGEAGQMDVRFRHRDGRELWMLMSGRPIHDSEGRFSGVLDMFTDITARRDVEQTLVESDRHKDQFLALLGHELRTPLSPILTATKILEMHGSLDPRLKKACETIARQTLHMSRLVDDLLDVGRVAVGKLRLDRDVVDVSALVKEAVDTCAPLIEARRHTLQVALPGEPVYVFADAGRLVQVLSNLLNNAAKYMQPEGRIELSAFRDERYVAIRIRDQGVGITPDMLHRIFDVFMQVGASGYRSDGGLGIGLWLVKSVVEMHDGRIEAHSDGLGKGSEFIVRLPVTA
jgi:PAS domain S-box-containing protein